MTQEDKQLLINDICARLPYGVKGLHRGKVHDLFTIDGREENNACIQVDGYDAWFSVDTFKPYLRPMSSMTEEDLRDFAQLKFKNNEIWEIDDFPKMKFGFKGFINVHCKNKHSEEIWIFQITTNSPLENYLGIDWLNAHHFDYRGLIEKGLALEAPEEMYKEK